MTLRHGSPDVDALFAAEEHMNEMLKRHPVSAPVPISNMILSRSLRTEVRMLSQYAAEAHKLRVPKAAAALEAAEEAVAEARLYLEGRKS